MHSGIPPISLSSAPLLCQQGDGGGVGHGVGEEKRQIERDMQVIRIPSDCM